METLLTTATGTLMRKVSSPVDIVAVIVDEKTISAYSAIQNYRANPAIACLLDLLEHLQTKDFHKVSVNMWREELAHRDLDYDVDILTTNNPDPFTWRTTIIVNKPEFGTARELGNSLAFYKAGSGDLLIRATRVSDKTSYSITTVPRP